jgi:hypothetical protein
MARILEGAAEGVPVTHICAAEGMPNFATVCEWRERFPEFDRAYRKARESLAERFAQGIAALADEARGLDSAGVQAVRLQVDTRKWIASRILPHTYGDHVEVKHSGALSIVGASAALRTVQPPTFDENGNEIEDATIVDEVPRALGAELAGVSTNGGGEHSLTASDSGHSPPPPGGAPGEGTPTSAPAALSPETGIPKFPAEIPEPLTSFRHAFAETPAERDGRRARMKARREKREAKKRAALEALL